MPPSTDKLPQMRFWVQVILTIFAGVLIPIALNLGTKLDSIEERLDGFDKRLVAVETWVGEGRRYTEADADRDIGVISQVLARQGLELDDHENRIRVLEKGVR